MLFATICICYLLMHIDDGVLSVASENIIHDLHITESSLGMVEAAMYIGILIGSLICPFLFATFDPKVLIIIAVFVNAVGVSAWAFTQLFYVLAGCRVLNGIFLVRFTIGFI